MTWRKWAYGKEDRTFSNLFEPWVIGLVIVLAAVLIGLGVWR